MRTFAVLSLLLLAVPAAAVDLDQLTFTGRDENWSTWSPDGTTVLFSSGEVICGNGEWFCGDQNIWQLQVSGGQGEGLQMLLNDAYHPRVSPDGKWVAGMVHNGRDWDVMIWPVGDMFAGQPFQSLPGSDERFPNWSNDSTRLAFDSDRLSGNGPNEFQVFWARLEDREVPDAAVQATFIGINNKHPTWNHDDTELAYVGDANNGRSISAVRLDDTSYRLVTPHSSQNRHPDWSPDGQWIAFTTDRWDGIGDVAIVRADGQGEPVRVTVGMEGHDDFPEWSHDSQRILFCGTAYVPPFLPNKEIFVASELPFDAAGVAVVEKSMGALKGAYSP